MGKRIMIPSMYGNAVPTFDAAAISSGMAFLVSELEKIDPKLREPLTSIRVILKSRVAGDG